MWQSITRIKTRILFRCVGFHRNFVFFGKVRLKDSSSYKNKEKQYNPSLKMPSLQITFRQYFDRIIVSFEQSAENSIVSVTKI